MKHNFLPWIVFDVGGVLLDWMSSSESFAREINLTHDQLFNALYAVDSFENIGTRMNLGQLSGQEGWNTVLSQFQLHLPFQDIVAAWTAQPFWPKDTLSLIRELKQAGHKLAIFSNSWFDLTNPATQDLLPAELQLFDVILDSAIEKIQKPNPAFYKRLEDRLDAHASDIFFIDDDQKNIATADNFSWKTFLYSIGEDCSQVVANNDRLRELLLM